MNLGWKYMILPWKGEEAFQELEVKGSMASLHPNPRRNAPLETTTIHKGHFTFTMENNEIRVSTTALASSVHSHFESFYLVGKVFGVPVPMRAIGNRLKSDWKNLQEEVFVDHVGRDWYKIEFYSEEDVDYELKHRPWFVQGQILALQRWKPDFSSFHASVESIDPDVLSDLVSILGTTISIDQASMVGKQSIRKKEPGHVCPIKISNKNYLQVERLNNEPNFFLRDLILDEEDQRKLQEDMILVFP
ncbi:hypothetical protein GBA52_020342 [Prunus armeniaca]|nr:hypothetical protein GBA52_020342 [Prunus armeniaca]